MGGFETHRTEGPFTSTTRVGFKSYGPRKLYQPHGTAEVTLTGKEINPHYEKILKSSFRRFLEDIYRQEQDGECCIVFSGGSKQVMDIELRGVAFDMQSNGEVDSSTFPETIVMGSGELQPNHFVYKLIDRGEITDTLDVVVAYNK